MSLRTRLILTHVFVIFLTLAILAVSLAFILHDYQRQVQLSRLGDAVVPLAFKVVGPASMTEEEALMLRAL